ncbi:hypothetical protein AB0O34_22085 [Sphaerisporangium sp. NPDC088356]|uniref:hypothetical protein n=1 Tax=Sphaerisporangium sp. NPDC088356 TaxID=3154871 RepID=UPI00342C131E
MKRSTVAVLVVACLGIGTAVIAPIANILLTSGCTADDDQLAASLATLGTLDVHPPTATPQGKRDSACETDDRVVAVWQSYRPSGSRVDLLSFYQDFAIKEGWSPAPDNQGGELSCFIKSIEGKDVYLSVKFPSTDREESGDGYDVNVSASLRSEGWCLS